MFILRFLHLRLLLFGFQSVMSLHDVELSAPTAVQVGETIVLGCKWVLDGNETLYSVKWYKGRQEFFSYLPKEFPYTRMFVLPGVNVDLSRSSSNQVVLMDMIRPSAGRYRCEVSADAPSFHTEVKSMYIHVVDLPIGKPTLKVDKIWYASGDSLRATCSSPAADPPANITWLVNGRDILGLPMIQQRISPSPVYTLQTKRPSTTTYSPFNERNIIFSPWKAFGPFVEDLKDPDTTSNQDRVVLPTTPNYDNGVFSTKPPVKASSRRIPSISQLSFMVKSDSFERGQLRITCSAAVYSIYNETVEVFISEEHPHLASVLGTRNRSTDLNRSGILILAVSLISWLQHFSREQ